MGDQSYHLVPSRIGAVERLFHIAATGGYVVGDRSLQPMATVNTI
jgi:hypothetical protein